MFGSAVRRLCIVTAFLAPLLLMQPNADAAQATAQMAVDIAQSVQITAQSGNCGYVTRSDERNCVYSLDQTNIVTEVGVSETCQVLEDQGQVAAVELNDCPENAVIALSIAVSDETLGFTPVIFNEDGSQGQSAATIACSADSKNKVEIGGEIDVPAGTATSDAVISITVTADYQ